MKKTTLLLCFTLFFFGCKKEMPYKIDASKITALDENGDPNGDNDPTDWQFDDEWSAKELSLFNFGDTIDTWGMQIATDLGASIAPNPASSVAMLGFKANQPTLLKWVITDEYLNILLKRVVRLERYSSVDPNMGFGIDVRNNKFNQPGYYRVYYAFYSQGGNLYKKGHGDFKKL